MSIIQGNAHTSAGGGTPTGAVERSLRFNSADSAYLNRTPASAGNRKTWTWSCWFKGTTAAFSTLLSGFDGSAGAFYIRFAGNGGGINVGQYNTGGSTGFDCYTLAVTRDPSAWYHIVVALDTTQATDTNRVKIYINSTLQTLTGTYPPQNQDCWINSTTAQAIGRFEAGIGQHANGCLTETYLVDGQALTPSDFGETDSATGVWKPKAYSGTYGTNGFYLKFADNSGTTSTTLGKDSSGNGNNWTPNNFSVTAGAGNDSLVDSPTAYGTDTGVGGEVRGNYATLNPLINPSADTFSNGNLQVVTSSSNYGTSVSSIAIPTTGKWYAECTIVATASYAAVGICSTSSVFTATSWVGSFTGVTYYGNTGQKVVNASASAYGATYGANDVIGIAYDADNLQITFYKNNTTQGTITGVTAGTYYFGSSEWDTASGTQVWNFGQRAFAYTAPSGFKALCTQNLPTPTIGATSTTQANDYFNAVLYTGTGSSLGVTGVGFQPDWTWIKGRSGATDHGLYDAVRGVQKQLESNTTTAETTETTGLTAFNSDGFTVGALAQLNTSSATYVAWNWKANGAGSSNTAGTITSTVSASTTSGFSIVTYTGNGTSGATVGHGLGVTPDMIIVKARSGGSDWEVFHKSLSASNGIRLNTTAAQFAASSVAGGIISTSPTSTTFGFTAGTSNVNNVNENTVTWVAYCFAPIAGYSAFGSYTGNGAADGPFVYTGFRPKYLMVKRTDTTADWIILDTARDTYNLCTKLLYPHLSTAEETYNVTDLLSNGFKQRNTFGALNASGGTYIYMAFAETPAKFSLAR